MSSTCSAASGRYDDGRYELGTLEYWARGLCTREMGTERLGELEQNSGNRVG